MTKNYLTDLQLAARYSVHRATIWRWSNESDFPAPIRLSTACTRWRASDVDAWEARHAGTMDEFDRFHNRLRMFLNIDKVEFDEALGRKTTMAEWMAFRDAPHMKFIQMPTDDARKIWALVKAREEGRDE